MKRKEVFDPKAAVSFTVGVLLVLGLCPAMGAPVDRSLLQSAYQPRRIALVIGIDSFKDPAWRGLHFAEKDAADMSKALENADAYFDKVIKLVEPWDTTRSSILEAVRQLDNMNMSTQDLILVYISTHGTLARDADRNLRQYLVAYDTEFDDIPETGIDVQELLNSFNRLTSRKKVLILAACHSGMGKSELPDEIEKELSNLKSGFFVEPVETASEASVVIGVCSWGETAQEDPALENDIYTHFFIEGMKSYDRNGDGAVSISEAHDYAQRKTYYYTGGKQRPFARSDILGADPIILTGKVVRPGMPVVAGYSEILDGALIRINGAEKGAFPDGFTTEPGWNRIEALSQNGGGDVFHGLVYVRQGERLDMDRLVEQRLGPNLGVLVSYRMMASQELSEEVLPGMPMYGLAYRFGGFPFSDSSIHLEASYGRNRWNADLNQGGSAQVGVDVYEANAALLFSSRGARSELFIGPMAGAFGMVKEIEVSGKSEERESGTVYPGLMGGVRFSVSRDMRIELSNRLSYHYLNVNDDYTGSLVNEVTLTAYFRPLAFLAR